MAFYKLLKKHALIPFKLEKPTTPTKSDSTETPESSTIAAPKSESVDAKLVAGDLKGE